MKKFLLYITIFFVFLVAIDKGVGIIARYLIEHANGGDTQKTEYICNKTHEDLLIMGSSRAVRHYDPQIINDSLHISCYNCAYIGCGCITAYGLLQALTNHYAPKYILYEVTPDFDYLKIEDDYSKYAGPLKYYYDTKGVDSIFINIDTFEKYKMMSNMYRYNSKLLQLIAENTAYQTPIPNGFLPEMRLMTTDPDAPECKHYNCNDEYKVKCLKNIVKLCKDKNIKLFFIVSPLYNAANSSDYDFGRTFAQENGIPFIDHLNDTTISKNISYFYDPLHMNIDGANTYTKKIIPELRAILK